MKNWALGALAVLLLGFVSPAWAAQVTLTGEVTYRERMALPPDATLKVKLVDLADLEAPPRVEAEAAIASPGQVPLNFTLNFEDGVVAKGHSYGLVAEIVSDGKLYFSSPAPFPIDPLAATGPIMIVVTFAGQIEAPAAPKAPAAPALLEIVWEAKTINGQPVIATPKSSLSITGDMRAGGRGGCNSYFAQARIDGSSLRFSAVAATRVSCAEAANQQEAAFFAALAATRFWRIDGDELFLTDAAGQDVVEFRKD